MTLGEIVLSIIDFLTYPTWHLVVFYAILFLIVAWRMVKSWGF